ncbi:MAG: VWA domain-containing protein [Rhodospirillaceae bacterium]|nr:VWA domain-containing protein [Rhodospirillaceae bacterium]|tara:strand:- start:95 stop:1270 length:1176 start_codon:yes stop_codon:yes gene_type:complete
MFTEFFLKLRESDVPATLREYLTLLEALDENVSDIGIDEFYYLSRSALVKDERNYDKFDRVFGEYFKGVEALGDSLFSEIPEEWLRREIEKLLSPEERAKLDKLGWEKLMETLRERLAEQKGRHQGGSKWIGTGGTSPFGAYGDHPEGVRIGQHEGRRGSAVKVWDKREYKNFDDSVVIGTRNIKVALRRLRQFVRDGSDVEFDLDDTIHATANNGGWLDVRMRPERHNKIRVLLLMDVGGSMNVHVKTCEELFSAARSEFKDLEYFYFHNCVYEALWKDNSRRHTERMATWDVIRTYPAEYKLIFVGDASMSPYEIAYPGGSVEHWNEEPGGAWMNRLLHVYSSAIWLNPEPEANWSYTQSNQMIRELIAERMYPLTLSGLEEGMKYLAR